MRPECSGKREFHTGRLRTLLSLFPKTLLWTGLASATAIGCAWVGTQHSVRFNGYQSEREMGRLPPMPTLANGLNELRASWEMEDGGSEDGYTRAEAWSKEVDGLWDRANAAEQDGDLRVDRDLLRQYLERTAIARHIWFDPKDRQRRRNSAIDRLDALKALERGSSVMRVRAYLNARRSHDAEIPDPEEIQRALEQAGGDPNLEDNVAYLKAAELYEQGDYAEAARTFGAVARQYPQSEKREGAIFMSGVALMKTSTTFGSHDEGKPPDDKIAGTSKPEVALDEASHKAVAVFKKLTTENPHGKFAKDARGWLAYLSLHSHDRVGALVEYYRLLGDKRDENARIEAAFSLQLVRGSATDEEMARVELALEREPDAALAYAYHNIYNYAIDPGPAYPPYDSERSSSQEREKEWQNERAVTGRKEMSRVLGFSKRLVGYYPNLAIGGGFALRAAQASLELGDNESAVQFARRAIQNGVGGDERAQALWTNGVAEYRLRHFDVARKNFGTLLAEYPSGRLIESARRMQAMIAEDSGDLDGALEHYIALEYNLDVAYFVDVLLKPEQLAAFIHRHAASPKHNELLYALGVRYLRANRWEEARKTLAQIKTGSPSNYSIYSNNSDCYRAPGLLYGCNDPKSGDLDAENKPIITAALIMRDVQTTNDLEALEQAVERAQGDEAKAEALYQLASYQYQASSLLFYNPVAWTGARYWNLSELAGGGKYRALNESQMLWEYMQQHETLSRALTLYLEVAQRFPRTRAARDALYTAAVCHERLSDYCPYWRDVYHNGLHAGPRMVTYAEVKASYPDYQLPRGTYAWEPATRTVAGGPGWSAPPKPAPPKPKPTRLARAQKTLFKLLRVVERFWDETGRHWTLVAILATATVIVAGISTWTRQMLRGQIFRLKLNEGYEDTYPWMMLFQVEPVELGPREQAKLYLRSVGERVRQLARDRQSRQVMAANIFAHSLLAWLFVVLLQTLLVG
jgi:thioredoxin-like negative regulator of GroEL